MKNKPLPLTVRHSLFILLVMFFSIGCDSSYSLQAHLQDYHLRMAKVLDVDRPEKLTISLPPYPALKNLEQHIPATTIKFFDFYNFKHCQLHALVAERNTSLGNLQLPSTRYIYERRLIDALKKCEENTTDLELQKKLANWQQAKTHQLPMVWANLIQLSSELKQGFSANFGLIQGNEQDGLIQIKESLIYLLNINNEKQINSAELESYLQNILNNPLPAKLWLSQLMLTEYLTRSTKWLLQHTENLQCSGIGSEKKMEYLTNVFQLFFIKKIQPIAGKINHYQYQLSPILEKMVSHPTLSPSFKNYINSLNQQGFENYQLAMQQHIYFWQDLFKRCNVEPGSR